MTIKNELEVKNSNIHSSLKTFEENHIPDSQEPKHNSNSKGEIRKEGNEMGWALPQANRKFEWNNKLVIEVWL